MTANVSQVAGLLGVARSTVQDWLVFFQRHKLIAMHRRRGGRGRGIQVKLTWLKQGQELAERRQRALAWKAQQVKQLGDTVVQGQEASTPLRGGINRARLMGEARITLMSGIHDPGVASQAVTAFGRWVWKENPSLELIQKVSRGFSEADRIPVPLWARTAQDVYRWLRSVIAKLVRYGTAWWGRMERVVERRRLERTLAKIKAAVDAGRPCPICKAVHDRRDWCEGRAAGGRLNCAGWARIKQDELQPQALEQRERVDTNEDLRRRWQDEKAEFKTPLWWYQ